MYDLGMMKARQEQFIDYLKHERGLSERTVEAYQRDLLQLQRELERQDITDLDRVSEHTIRALIARRHRQGQGRSSR